MYKLLSDEERKRVAEEYALRRWVVVSLGIALVMLIGIVSLLPSFVLSDARLKEVVARSQVSDPGDSQEEREDLLEWLSGINKRLAILSPEPQDPMPLEYFEEFLTKNFEGITVTSLVWDKSDKALALSVSGTASDRQRLLRFEEHINSTGLFARAAFPVSQLAKEKDIEFQITLLPLEGQKQKN